MAVCVFNEADLAQPPVEREARRPIQEAAQLAADLAGMLYGNSERLPSRRRGLAPRNILTEPEMRCNPPPFL
jgi:hypothetical protein